MRLHLTFHQYRPDNSKEKGGIFKMFQNEYLMENMEEITRLNVKTDCRSVTDQARWAGIQTGMQVADIGCGSGKTSYALHNLVQPGGTVIGIDGSEERTNYADQTYGKNRIKFFCRDIREDLCKLGMFDFVWVRFILEYYRKSSFDIVKNISRVVRPGGILCLIDLDHNCLSHYGLPKRLEKTVFSLMTTLEIHSDFDPFAGRKLYSHLYRLGYEEIDVKITAHHLIFGELDQKDAYNWGRKIEIASRRIGYRFEEYEKGYDEFVYEFNQFFSDPGRFTYTPLIICRGRKPFAC
jgi:ubiquinone/menaquinone biosynthesis C-methylase UbiE